MATVEAQPYRQEMYLAQDEMHTQFCTELNQIQIFTFRHYRFVYYARSNRYEQIGQWKDPDWYNEDLSQKEGLSRAKVEGRHSLFGPCLIDVQEKSYLRLFYDEVVNLFYIFQIASVAVWCYEEYYYYACAILVISAVSIIANLVAAKSTMRKMQKMVIHTCPVTVLRGGDWLQVASECLVPGDIIDLGSSKLSTLPCDAVVLEGDCIVNESMLTGESVPEFKYPLEKRSEFFSKIDMAACTFKPFISRHMVFAGTRLVRVRKTESAYGCMATETPQENMRATAMVLRTGFCSTKGGLVRSILFPRPTKFQFYRDAFRFVGILAVVAVIGFAVNTVNLHSLGVSASTIAIKALDLITVVVPPALPASMSIGMAFAVRRLSKKGIFCISPSRINVASKVAVICFDKTGTLTEEGLDLLGIGVSDRSRCQFLPLCSEVSELVGLTSKFQDEKTTTCADVAGINILEAIASCHSLQLVDNQLVGDPLEIKMFEFSGWKMYENENTRATVVCPPMFASYANEFSHISVKEEASSCYLSDQGGDSSYKECPCAVEIIKSFDFASELRRASVVVQKQSTKQHAEVYVKGAPEVIKDICLPETVPSEYAAILDDYTQKGLRVIAIAGKSINNWSLLSANGMIPQRAEAEVSDISCVADVLKEGRCSIATSFGCFKYMMLYSMIQFTTCCLLYIYNTNLTNGQFLYVDLFIIIPIAVCMNRAKPFKKLVPKRPSASLISKRVLTSLVGNIALIIGFQIAIYFMTGAQSWYKKPVPKKADDPDSTPLEGHLNTSIFLFSTFQYIFTGLIFSIGPPYRQPISQNRLYLATLVILLAFDLWMVLVPVKGFYSLFGLVHVSVGWRFVILGMGVANFVLCYCGEQYLFPWVAPRAAKVVRFFRLVWNRYLQREYVGDRTNTSKCLENGAGTRNVTTSGIWQRAGKRENRKDYKLVLEKMPGKAEWY
ncbi:hypothetical protein EV177_000584 [Coemansia sp. RSA 1804]|nr:hypothetical protein EV177_000584 [Coemansia sp. RSA 1804]